MTAWGEHPTRRELEVFANSLLHGRKEAAIRLGIARSTARNHISSLYRKLGLEEESKGAWVHAAIALGWLDLPAEHVTTGSRPAASAEYHHELSEQLLNYADSIFRELENR